MFVPLQPLDYYTPSGLPPRSTLRIAIVVFISGAVGLFWEIIAVKLMGGKFEDAGEPSFLLAGIVAGIAAGAFTVWTRHVTNGRESLFLVVTTYYLGILCFVGSLLLAEVLTHETAFWIRVAISEAFKLAMVMLIYGTVPFGIALIPLCFLSRLLVWQIYLHVPTAWRC